MLPPFEIHQPDRVEAASELFARYGEEATFYAGGTELLLVMKAGFVRYRHLIDLKTIRGLNAIEYDGRWLSIGGTVTHRAVERHPVVQAHFPLLVEMERLLANVRVRTVGTLGGNLCFAEPHADPGTVLLVHDAEAELVSGTARRTVPIPEFFVGAYETARAPDEVLARIRVREWDAQTRGAYLRFGIHERPTLGVAVSVRLDRTGAGLEDVRIAVGCVGPIPVRMAEAEARLRGRSVREAGAALPAAAAIAGAAADAVDDLHGSAEYKREMVEVFVRRAYQAAVVKFQDARGVSE